MGTLRGLQEYLDERYHLSVFDQALESKEPWEFRVCGQEILRGRVAENQKYDVKLNIEGKGEEVVPKLNIKLLYPVALAEKVSPLIKVDQKVRKLGLEPILSPSKRNHIKNKSLFPLMKEREVVFFTLLEGEVIKGLVTDFTRYDIVVSMKGGVPVTLLRHAVHDLRNKKGRCFLKSSQEGLRDWEKSPLYEE
ncbi:MAG: hypothetical protein JRH06_13180 [Deltaproteobacteria bacterium]|nr:hypothetical protein [Deltaproteobacteria bacterium]MBW2138495.1 hypothetical protein [Deltaproteobacteria bacterium]